MARARDILIVVLSIVGAGLLDYAIGFEVSLFPLYLIPLGWLAQRRGTNLPITFALVFLAGLICSYADLLAGKPYSNIVYPIINFVERTGILMLVCILVSKHAELLRKQEEEIVELREIIPICAWCHSVRNDRGIYEKADIYIQRLARGKDLTHGICPSCKETMGKEVQTTR